MNRFEGKVAIITGASTGLGRAFTEMLLAEGVLEPARVFVTAAAAGGESPSEVSVELALD